MAQSDDTHLDRPGRKALLAGSLLFVLALLVAIADGIGAGLILIGLVVLVVGAIALVRGRAHWLHIVSRRAALAVTAAGLAALIVGGVVSPPTQNTAAEATAPTTTAPTTTAPTATAAAPTTRSTSAATTTAPQAALAVPIPTTTQAPVRPPAPVMAMTCPAAGTVAAPAFGRRIAAAGPYSITIDYGDGDVYTNDDQHLGAIFGHTYRAAGTYTVSAVLTDPAGQTATARCSYSWTRPVPVAPSGGRSSGPVPSGGSSTGGSTGGGATGGDTYTNVDGNQVSGPVEASSAPAGATAHCTDGTWSFSQHRSGTCSGHGGVAAWL